MKRMLALVLCLGLANVARAADDAPVIMVAGDPAPVAGVLLPNDLAVRRAKELTALRTENAELKAAPAGMPVGLVVLLVVAGVVAGGAVGYGVAKAVK